MNEPTISNHRECQQRRVKRVVALAVACMIASASANPAIADGCARIRPTQPGEVYLMRGLANIFSLGLDTYGTELSKRGIENCVFNHSAWKAVVNDIVERNYRGEVSHPVVIVGHSLGANIAPQMATSIGKHNIPVAYVVMLDPVEPQVVGANVAEIVNYYLPHRKDNRLYAGSGFTGMLENINVKQFGGFDHFNIDEKTNLRSVVLTRVLALSSEAAQETRTKN